MERKIFDEIMEMEVENPDDQVLIKINKLVPFGDPDMDYWNSGVEIVPKVFPHPIARERGIALMKEYNKDLSKQRTWMRLAEYKPKTENVCVSGNTSSDLYELTAYRGYSMEDLYWKVWKREEKED